MSGKKKIYFGCFILVFLFAQTVNAESNVQYCSETPRIDIYEKLSATNYVVYDSPGPNTVDPDYKHAPTEAIERFLDMKFGVRMYVGCFSVVNGTDVEQASWSMVMDTGPVGSVIVEEKNLLKEPYLAAITNKESPEKIAAAKEVYWKKLREFLTMYERFTFENFDGQKWGELFKETGFKFAVLTSKNCDGFHLWPTLTKVDALQSYQENGETKYRTVRISYSVADTPFGRNGRDLLKEYVDGLRANDIAVGIYYTNPDWLDYDFRCISQNIFNDPTYTYENDPESWNRMVMKHRQELLELCTNYGPIDQLCLDMGFIWPYNKENIKIARKLQPNVMMRWRGIGAYGDYDTPETGPTPGEARVSPIPGMSNQLPWSKIRGAVNESPTIQVIRALAMCISLGGTMQWNCHPRPDGTFDPDLVKRMHEVGDWLQLNGEAVYSTRNRDGKGMYFEGEAILAEKVGMRNSDYNAVHYTRSKDNKYVYAFLLKWPGEKLVLEKFRPAPGSKIKMFGVEEDFNWKMKNKKLMIDIPEHLQKEENRPCKYVWVLKMETRK